MAFVVFIAESPSTAPRSMMPFFIETLVFTTNKSMSAAFKKRQERIIAEQS